MNKKKKVGKTESGGSETQEEEGWVSFCAGKGHQAPSDHGRFSSGTKGLQVRALSVLFTLVVHMLGVVAVTWQEPNDYLLNKGTDERT